MALKKTLFKYLFLPASMMFNSMLYGQQSDNNFSALKNNAISYNYDSLSCNNITTKYNRAKEISDYILNHYSKSVKKADENYSKLKGITDDLDSQSDINQDGSISNKEVLEQLQNLSKEYSDNDVLILNPKKCSGIYYKCLSGFGFILENGKLNKLNNVENVLEDIKDSYDANSAKQIDEWYKANKSKRISLNSTKLKKIDPYTIDSEILGLNSLPSRLSIDKLLELKNGQNELYKIIDLYGYDKIKRFDLIETIHFRIGELYGVYNRYFRITYTYALAICPDKEYRYVPIFQEPIAPIPKMQMKDLRNLIDFNTPSIRKTFHNNVALGNERIYFHYSPENNHVLSNLRIPLSRYRSYVNWGDGTGMHGLTQDEAENLFSSDMLKILCETGQSNVGFINFISDYVEEELASKLNN